MKISPEEAELYVDRQMDGQTDK